jgi:transposase
MERFSVSQQPTWGRSPATARLAASHLQMISIFQSQLSPQGVSRDSPTPCRGRETAVQHEQMQNLYPRCQQGAGSRARAKDHRQRYHNSIVSLVACLVL